MRFTLTLDSSDPEHLARFWAAALGYTALGEFGVFWPLAPPDENEHPLIIQRVTEPKLGKNRMHLDLHVENLSSEVSLRCTRSAAHQRSGDRRARPPLARYGRPGRKRVLCRPED